jgi:hypothetical protein
LFKYVNFTLLDGSRVMPAFMLGYFLIDENLLCPMKLVGFFQLG